MCGSEVDEDWEYCPRCGFRLKGESFLDIFSKVQKEFEEMSKSFDKDFEVFDLSPWSPKKLKSSGFSIKIIHDGRNPPKIFVKTYGDVNKKRIEKEIYDKFGVRSVPSVELKDNAYSIPKVTEEPKTEVRRVGNKILVNINLPDVKSENDINIKSLENSVEIKAMAKDKAYFKIITKPAEFKVGKHEFKDGVLYLEFVVN